MKFRKLIIENFAGLFKNYEFIEKINLTVGKFKIYQK